MRYWTAVVCLHLLVALRCGSALADDIRIEQIVSREHPAFICRDATMTVGRDGVVYLSNQIHNGSFILKIDRDGSNKLGGLTEDAVGNATATAQGVIATANGHFARKVNFLDPHFHKTAEIAGFLGDDSVGWDAPIHVEVGASGNNVYALDQHRSRIVEAGPDAKIIRAFALPPEPAHSGDQQDFRVCEKNQCFFVISRQPGLKCVGFDGVVRWTIPDGYDGGFDVDDDGNLYRIGARDNHVKVVDPTGKELKTITLQMGDNAPGDGDAIITGLRIFADDLIIKRRHRSELFQRYDRVSGAFKNLATAAGERIALTAAADPWIAGTTVPFKIGFVSAEHIQAPLWRVWVKPFGSNDYEQWALMRVD